MPLGGHFYTAANTKTSPFEIDQVHQQFKRDSWEKVIPATLLLDLDNRDQISLDLKNNEQPSNPNAE